VQSSYTLVDLQNWRSLPNDAQPIRLGVFGNPVEHSLSPQMQNAALEACGIEMQYVRFHIQPAELKEALRLLPSLEFVGVNLTLPHKVNAIALVDALDPSAQQIGAINAIRIKGDKLFGFNTDGPAFARAIRHEFSVDLRDLRVLVLGAGGGAGRAIAHQCAREGCERLVLVNRTQEKAAVLADEMKASFADARVAAPVARLQVIGWDEQAIREQIANIDLVVNASSVGMRRSDRSPISATIIAPHLMVYDTVYTRARTPLLAAADEAGARGANGLSMLLHQGALAFESWFDRDAPIDVMRRALQ